MKTKDYNANLNLGDVMTYELLGKYFYQVRVFNIFI